MKLAEKAARLKTDIPAVFLCMKSKETPAAAKVLAAITIGYALSPVDLIPDFIPFLGYLDDLLILPLLVMLTIRLIPKETFERCRVQAQGMWKDGKPKKWFYAIPVVIIWLVVLWLILRAFLLGK
ncbi:MAG TPA: DUF1232 domain-containing protein [Clostridia bacterium]|nr:DUF1232 domain-containing protein [Clostridia bacterium]